MTAFDIIVPTGALAIALVMAMIVRGTDKSSAAAQAAGAPPARSAAARRQQASIRSLRRSVD